MEHNEKYLAKQARDNARLLQKVAEITRNTVIVTDTMGKIEWVNASFEAVTGYRLKEVIGRKPGDFLQGPKTSPDAIRRIGAHIRAGQGVSEKILNYSKDGAEYWIDLDVQPVHNDLGELQNFVAVQTNITSLKKQEEALRLARDEAERASRLKSRFVANVSHELRTPLNGIVGMAEYLSASVPADFSEDLATMHHSARHLLHVLNELIDLASIEAGVMNLKNEPFCLQSLLQESLHIFEANAGEKDLDLVLVTPNASPDIWLEGDETRLRQVLMNLIGNAIKFTEEGSVTLQCSVNQASDEENEELAVDFMIRDTGPGIAESDQSRIFQHFERLDVGSAGAGLGLAISQEILALMGARLAVTSTPGEGSCFSFSLGFNRAKLSEINAGENMEQVTGKSQKNSCQVFVVDDDPVNLKVIQKLSGKLGVSDMRLCLSGARALEEWRGLRPDIVLVDIRMPGMDGHTFLNLYRQQESFSGDSPLIVACSASNTQADEEKFLAAGFDRFLAKPVDVANLSRILDLGKARGKTQKVTEAADARPVITASLESKMANNTDLIYSFLEQLADTHEKRWEGIDQAITDNDPVGLATAIHTLKGQVGYFGEDCPAYQKAFAADQAMKADAHTIPLKLVEEIRQEMQSLTGAIRQELAKKTENP